MQMLEDSVENLSASASCRPRTVLITGCSSGIGLHASKLLGLLNPKNKLILVARNSTKAETTKKAIEAVLPGDCTVITMSCDMTSLASVRTFARNLHEMVQLDRASSTTSGILGGIDVLCLNAAVLVSGDAEPKFTEDGLEVTFQTNYLAPFLLTNLIVDTINPGGRIVITTSGLHSGPRFAKFRGMLVDDEERKVVARNYFLMVDGTEFDYKKSYAMSKLCLTTFCMALQRRLQSRRIIANCFTPGLLPLSGLFRHQTKKIVPFMNGVDETIEWGGGALAWMAVSDEAGKQGGQFFSAPMGSSRRGAQYGREFCSSPIPKEACNLYNQDLLWKLSSQLAGVSEDTLKD